MAAPALLRIPAKALAQDSFLTAYDPSRRNAFPTLKRLSAWALLLVAATRLVLAADDGGPASTNVMGAADPRIDGGGRATFQLKAPDAQKVAVQLPQGRYGMTKGADGVWRVTRPALVPGFHSYTFSVDGVSQFKT